MGSLKEVVRWDMWKPPSIPLNKSCGSHGLESHGDGWVEEWIGLGIGELASSLYQIVDAVGKGRCF